MHSSSIGIRRSVELLPRDSFCTDLSSDSNRQSVGRSYRQAPDGAAALRERQIGILMMDQTQASRLLQTNPCAKRKLPASVHVQSVHICWNSSNLEQPSITYA
jgi:hypothetical protein